MNHSLKLGNFDLVGGGFGADYTVETIAEGMNFGMARGRDVVVETLLQDGAAMSRDGYDNREVTFGVLITAADSLGMAQGEAALAAEIGRRNKLVWQPPDQWGPPSVYVVVMSSMEFEFDDWGEMQPGTVGRRFVLSLTCKPFAQSLASVVIEAVGSGETPPVEDTVLVDNCASATGWESAFIGTTVSAVSGRLRVGNLPSATGAAQMVVRRTGTVDLTGTPFLILDVYPRMGKPVWSQSHVSFPVGSGTQSVFPIATGPSPDFAGATRLWFRPEVAALSSFWVGAYILPPAPYFPTLIPLDYEIESISRTNLAPFTGTGRQQFRSLIVTGSARTEGSLQIAHETQSLGVVAAYTNRDDGSGYQPACRVHRTGGGSVDPDSATASGSSSPLNAGTPETYDIPTSAVPPGTYAPMSRLRADVAGFYNVTLTASLLSGSSELGSVTMTRSVEIGTSWKLHELGALPLPTVAVPAGSTAKIRIELSSTGAVEVDDTYLFNLTIGALTWVDCGTGTPAPGGSSNRLWIDTASLDVPRPAIWVGTQADRSDARHIEGGKVFAEMPHQFEPGDVNLFTVTSNALNAAASLEFYPNWHSNAAA